MLTVGDTGVLLKLKSSTEFRCNVGFTDLDGTGATIELTLYGEGQSGLEVVGQESFSVAPWANRQVDRVFRALGVTGDHEVALATVEVTSGGTVYAYASNVDNRTGDAEFIPATRP